MTPSSRLFARMADTVWKWRRWAATRLYRGHPTETPDSIRAWALATFGPHKGALSVANRAQKELDELKEAAQQGAPAHVLAEEAADVVIVLCRLFGWEDVERKMVINRGRTWRLDGNGHGQHIKKPPTS